MRNVTTAQRRAWAVKAVATRRETLKNDPLLEDRINRTVMMNTTNGWTSYKGYHKSPKAGRVYFRSKQEEMFYRLLDRDERVTNYFVEPFALPYTFEGREKLYYPDLLISTKTHARFLVEIKQSHELIDLQTKAKIRSGQSAARRLRIGFRVFTQRHLTSPLPLL